MELKNCARPEDLASYLACRLPKAEAEAIEQHLYTCPDCVDTVRSLESQDRFFGALEAVGRGQCR